MKTAIYDHKESDEIKVAITYNGRTVETTGKHIRLFALSLKKLKRQNALESIKNREE